MERTELIKLFLDNKKILRNFLDTKKGIESRFTYNLTNYQAVTREIIKKKLAESVHEKLIERNVPYDCVYEKKKREELEQRLYSVEFEIWQEALSTEEKLKIVPASDFAKPGNQRYTVQLKEYFRSRIWQEKRREVL
jgi:hypothetical protein